MTAIRLPDHWFGATQQEAYRVVCANPTARTRDVALAVGRGERDVRRSLVGLENREFVYRKFDPTQGFDRWYPVETEGDRK